jgi:hypothetical protein
MSSGRWTEAQRRAWARPGTARRPGDVAADSARFGEWIASVERSVAPYRNRYVDVSDACQQGGVLDAPP